MGIDNRDVRAGAGGKYATLAYQAFVLAWAPQVGNSITDGEYASVVVPADSDWQYVSAHAWCKAITSDPTCILKDDGTAITAALTLVAGAATVMVESSAPTRIAGGSEIQLHVTTDGGDTVDGLCVTLVLRPYPLAEAGIAVT